MRFPTARRTRVLVPPGSLPGRRLAVARSTHLPIVHRSRPEVSELDQARDQLDQASPRGEGEGQHLTQTRMQRDLCIVAALALPLSATWTWQETSSRHRAGGLAEPDRWLLPSPTPSGADPFGRMPHHKPSEGWAIRLSALLLHQPLDGHPRDLQAGVRRRRDRSFALE